MLHSEKIMQGMIARKPNEENGEQAAPVEATQPEQARSIADFLHRGAPSQQEAAYTPEVPPYADPAAPILRTHGIGSETAADVWDLFHSVRDSKQLADKLQAVDIPNATKHELVIAKQKNDPAPTWHDKLDRVIEVINKHLPNLHETSSARGGKSSITTADRHPNVLRAFLDAQKKDGADNE